MEKGFPADAHDAGRRAVDWKTVFQLMLMMLAAGRWIGKTGFKLMLMMLAAGRWSEKTGVQLMLMMLAAGQWIGKRVSSLCS